MKMLESSDQITKIAYLIHANTLLLKHQKRVLANNLKDIKGQAALH